MTGGVKVEDLWHRSMPLSVWQMAINFIWTWARRGGEVPYNWIQLQIVSVIMHTTP